MKAKLHICCMCVGDLGSAYASSLDDYSVSVSPHGPRFVDSVGLLVFLAPPAHSILSPHSSTTLPALSLMFGKGETGKRGGLRKIRGEKDICTKRAAGDEGEV